MPLSNRYKGDKQSIFLILKHPPHGLLSHIVLTEKGMLQYSISSLFAKAARPIVRSESGRVKLCNPIDWKAPSHITQTPSFII